MVIDVTETRGTPFNPRPDPAGKRLPHWSARFAPAAPTALPDSDPLVRNAFTWGPPKWSPSQALPHRCCLNGEEKIEDRVRWPLKFPAPSGPSPDQDRKTKRMNPRQCITLSIKPGLAQGHCGWRPAVTQRLSPRLGDRHGCSRPGPPEAPVPGPRSGLTAAVGHRIRAAPQANERVSPRASG